MSTIKGKFFPAFFFFFDIEIQKNFLFVFEVFFFFFCHLHNVIIKIISKKERTNYGKFRFFVFPFNSFCVLHPFLWYVFCCMEKWSVWNGFSWKISLFWTTLGNNFILWMEKFSFMLLKMLNQKRNEWKFSICVKSFAKLHGI